VENSCDDFLLEILWTTLDFMSHASNDIRCFLCHYTPKWSLLNACRYRRKNETLWAELRHKFSHKLWRSEHNFTVLDLGKYDMSWQLRDGIQNAEPMETMDEQRRYEFALGCIGKDYRGVYQRQLDLLLLEIFHVRDTTTKFLNSYDQDRCLQTKKDDRKRHRYTCYNPYCLKCWKSTEFIQIINEENFILR
jgi:hypothetical protein